MTDTSALLTDLPEDALIVLIGASGAGKSTLASSWPASQVLSLDTLRATVSGSAGDQSATQDAADALALILDRRMARGLTTVIDATNLETSVRVGLVGAARRHGMPAVAVIVPAPLSVCLTRQASRPDNRRVPHDTVCKQHQAVPSLHQELLTEGFTHVALAAQLSRLGAHLRRLTEAYETVDSDLLLPLHHFGPQILPLWRWVDGSGIADGYRVAEIRLGAQHLTLALNEDADNGPAFDVLVDCRIDPQCTAPTWAPARTVTDLYEALIGITARWATCTMHGSITAPATAAAG